MKRVLLTIVCGLALVLVGCGGQGGEELYTIGVFQFSSNALLESTVEGFLQAMEDAGYEDGVNVRYQFENAQADIPTAQLIAQQLNGPDVNLIFVASTPALQAVLGEVKEKPVVFGAIANPYILGAGESAEDHLPNVTGASATSPMRQAMELMLEALPDAKRAGILSDPANANSRYNMEVAQKAATELGVEIVDMTISGSTEVLQAAQALSTKDIDAFFVIPDHIVMESFDSLVKVADQTHIPPGRLSHRLGRAGGGHRHRVGLLRQWLPVGATGRPGDEGGKPGGHPLPGTGQNTAARESGGSRRAGAAHPRVGAPASG